VNDSVLLIDPETKVAALLDHYPELEDVLIAIAPPFKKLRNPILRRSVARVASLRQAAAVAGLPVDEVVNTLRNSVGQEAIDADLTPSDTIYFAERPPWFDLKKLVLTVEESELDPDTMPLTELLAKAKKLQDGEMLVLVTNFLPAPGIDIIKRRGFLVWTIRERDEVIKTYVSAP
jgi:hypothetical protein